MKRHGLLVGAILVPLALACPVDAMAENFTTVGHSADGFWTQTSADACVTTVFFAVVDEVALPGGGAPSFNTADITYFSVNGCTDASTAWRGYTDVDVGFSPNPGLSQARLSTTVPVFGEHCSAGICSELAGQVSLDVRWTGDGSVEKSSFTDRSSSADGMRFTRTVGSSRPASTSGEVTLDGGPNIIASPAESAFLRYGRTSTLYIDR